MPALKIAATDRTPAVEFDFDGHRLKLKGESYPEDAAAFYGPVLQALDDYLARLGDGSCSFEFELIYFNSSSAKAIMTLLEKLDKAAGDGAAMTINWYYDEEDDTMKDLGEEFAEDLEHTTLNVEKMVTEG